MSATEPRGPSGDVIDVSGSISRRFLLWRIWDYQATRLLWVGLNPSTATAETDDPTVLKIAAFSKRAGAGGFEIVNLISQRTPHPSELFAGREPVSADVEMAAAMVRCGHLVAAWGAANVPKRCRSLVRERIAHIRRSARMHERGMFCLGTTAKGNPRHPLYLPYDTPIREWEP